jgi:hypothetical protein
MKTDIVWRVSGLLLGAGIALVALASWRMPPAGGRLGADVRILSAPTGELDVSPAGPFLSVTNLEPGSPGGGALGELGVRNQTGSRLSVRVRLLPSTADLDALLRVRVSAGGERLLDGTLGGLRTWSAGAFHLSSGERRELHVQAWLPGTVRDGYQGRVEDVGLELRAERAET